MECNKRLFFIVLIKNRLENKCVNRHKGKTFKMNFKMNSIDYLRALATLSSRITTTIIECL